MGTNVSGTSDLAPLDQQADMIHELFPDAKNVGLLYCSAEPNSVYQVDVIAGLSEGARLQRAPGIAFTDTNDVSLRDRDRLLTTSDVHLHPHRQHRRFQHRGHRQRGACPRRCPSSPARRASARGCGVATLSISYYDLGYEHRRDGLRHSGQRRRRVHHGRRDTLLSVTKKYNAANVRGTGHHRSRTATRPSRED